MRILAIRGANLASLAAPFEIDFETSPLVDVGLFAIAGPTGSGKSTLLDALCLALFDTIPRLPSGHGVPVGRADEDPSRRLRNTDVRSVLRRGAAEGFAEVDFLGNDSRRYRARWEVRRARRRADGKVQPQQLSLTDLVSGQRVGQTKTEVLAAIHDRLGLNFDQFRRSVLLAQGDFAAFLRASADERASLLERITGTGLYSALSREAFQRAAREQAALNELSAQRSGFEPLADDDRRLLEQAVAESQEKLTQLNQQKAALSQALDWYAQHDGLLAQLQQAREQLDAAQRASAAARARRERLQQVRAAQPHRAILTQVNVTAERLARAQQALAEADSAAQSAAARLAVAQTEQQQAAATLGQHRTAFDQAKPQLQQAHALDTQLGVAQRALDQICADQREGEQGLVSARQAVERHAAQQQTAQQQRQAALAWLSEHRQYGLLVREWPRWDRELQRIEQLLGEQQQTERALSRLAERRRQAQDAVAQRAQQVETQTVQLAELRGQLDQIDVDLQASPSAALRRELQALLQAQEWLGERGRLQRQIASVLDQLSRQQASRQQADAAIAAARQQITELGQALPLRRAQCDEAERAYRLALASQEQQTQYLRGLLQDGQPCPVCGSEQHPWHDRVGVLDAQVQTLKARVASLRAERDTLERQLAQQQGAMRALQASSDTAGTRLAQLETERLALSEQWAELADEQFAGRTPDEAGLGAALEQALEQLQQTLQMKKAALAAIESQAQTREQLRHRLDCLREQQDAAQTAARQASQTLTELNAEQLHRHTQLSRLQRQLEAACSDLDDALAPFAGWRQRLIAESGRLREQCLDWVERWQTQERQRDASQEVLAELKQAAAVALAGREHAAQLVARQAARQSQQRALLDQLQGQRAALFGGRSAAAVEAELEQAVATAQLQLEAAGARLGKAQVAAAQAHQARRDAESSVAREQQAAAQANLALQQLLAATTYTRQQLEALLAETPEQMNAEAQALQHLDAELSRAQSVFGEREAVSQRHAASRPQQERAHLVLALQQLAPVLVAATETANAQAFAQRQDDEHRARWRETGQALEQQLANTRLWASLNELIGSADGRKFRVFAQSLTLEALLGYANIHLQELSHRYRLQRVPGSDLDLQIVDADMGDEIRSVHSLSGGESFLVSLALALGLASLSSQRAQVESLFIDEGFGSLDQDALDIAISSLDSLQSLGRRVGVISHVQTLVERIGTRVMVRPVGAGKSVVTTLAN